MENKMTLTNKKSSTDSIVIYRDPKGELQLDVKLEKETVWLTQKQIADLFETERSVITKHISNIFKSGELEKGSNVQKMHIPFSDKPVEFYDLDVIISVGYRVNSKQATQFRIWSTKILKEYLIQGYAANKKMLLEQKYKFLELQRTVKLLTEKSNIPLLRDQTQELLKILNDYTNSLSLLFKYDEGKLKPYKKQKPDFILTYDHSNNVIEKLKENLREKDEAGSLFGK